MKYSINVRMRNPGESKYLIESVEKDDAMEAFHTANEFADKNTNEDYFVEIVNNETGEQIAKFK